MFRENKLRISDSEWLVMQVIWNKSPCNMGEIVAMLKNTPWSRTTIQTMVVRLVAKNAIKANTTNFAFLYSPNISEEDAVKMYTNAFIARMFKGNSFDCVATVVTGDYLTEKEKKELKKLF